MPPRSAAAPSSCRQTDRQADARSDIHPQSTDVGWVKGVKGRKRNSGAET